MGGDNGREGAGWVLGREARERGVVILEVMGGGGWVSGVVGGWVEVKEGKLGFEPLSFSTWQQKNNELSSFIKSKLILSLSS